MNSYPQRIRFVIIVALIMLSCGALAPAHASTGTLTIPGTIPGLFKFGDEVVNLNLTGYGSENVYAGIFDSKLSNLSDPLGSYQPGQTYDVAHVCNEITQYINLGGSYNYTILPLTDPNFPAPYLQSHDAAVAGEIGSVVNDFLNVDATNPTYDNGLDSSNQLVHITSAGTTGDTDAEADWSAATQVAIWDLSYNGLSGSPQLTVSGDANVLTDAQAILTYEAGHSSDNAVWFHSGPDNNPPNTQDQLLRIQPVPEPGFIQLAAFLSLGGLGLLRKRRGTGLRTATALAI